jgi:hypothetical protein
LGSIYTKKECRFFRARGQTHGQAATSPVIRWMALATPAGAVHGAWALSVWVALANTAKNESGAREGFSRDQSAEPIKAST